MYMFEITFSYIQDGKRIKETDVFYGNSTQEAVDICRAENLRQFADQYGRIEIIFDEYAQPATDWE